MFWTVLGTILWCTFLGSLLIIFIYRDKSVLPEETSQHLIGSDEDDPNFKSDEGLKDKSDIKGLTLLGKIEKVKEQEKALRIKIKEEAKEEERKRKEYQAQKFSYIKATLQELKHTYAKDKDIDIEVFKSAAVLVLRNSITFATTIIFIDVRDRALHPESLFPPDYIVDKQETYSHLPINIKEEKNNHHRGDYYTEEFDSPDQLIDYIIENVGRFLAERESG